MACTVELTAKEVEALSVIVDYWLDGMADAREATIADNKTLETLEQLLDATDGLNETEALLKNVRHKLSVRYLYND